MYIYNLTQHSATTTQKKDGVADVDRRHIGDLKSLLDFKEMPTTEEIGRRAKLIADIAYACAMDDDQYGYHPVGAMIGGAPWLMPALTQALKDAGFNVYFAYSPRVSKDIIRDDGTVEKVSTFEYQGLFEV